MNDIRLTISLKTFESVTVGSKNVLSLFTSTLVIDATGPSQKFSRLNQVLKLAILNAHKIVEVVFGNSSRIVKAAKLAAKKEKLKESQKKYVTHILATMISDARGIVEVGL